MKLLDASLPESIECAARLLRAGEVVAYPTETVYGLAVDPFNPDAIARLFAVKGRPAEKAVLLIIGRAAHLERLTTRISPQAQAYMDAFWPGPLSLLLPRHPDLPEELAPGLDSICVRCPGASVARALCDAFGGAITSTSANASGEVPVQRLTDLTLPDIALGLDGGVLADSKPSTIVDAATGEILRDGAISRTALAAQRLPSRQHDGA